MFIGSELGVVEGKYQPMKIAAAEALWTTCPSHCPFSAFQIGGGPNDETPTQIIEIPDLLSILATNHPDGEVQGMNNLQAQYVKEYGPGNYIPNVFIQYWGMRVMAYLAALIALFALWGLWLIRRKTLGKAKWFLLIAPWFAIAPFLMNTAGWLLTESGRQPWIVQGLMKTSQAASPSVTSTDIWISLTVFVLMYLALGVADVYLMIHYGRQQLEPSPEEERRRRWHGRRQRQHGGVRRRPGPGPHLLGDEMVHLNNVWFVIIAIFWVGFFILEGFDFGVGMLHSFVGKDDVERRIAVNYHRAHLGRERGVAGRGGSGDLRRLPVVVRHDVLHLLPGMVIVLLALIVRGVSFEYHPQDRRPAVAVGLEVVAHDRKRAHPLPARHRPGRPPPWAAHQLLPQLHRQLLGSAGSLRALHRSHRDRALPVRRRRLPDAQDRGSAARPGGSSVGPTRVAGRGDHLRLADVAPCRDQLGLRAQAH